MSVSSADYCLGYLVTPVVEACRQRGLFERLDPRGFRDRASLIRELGANEGCFGIALEVLEAQGWIESDGAGGLRRASEITPMRDPGPMALYAIEPGQLIERESYACLLRGELEQYLLLSEEGRTADILSGSVLVPLIVALQGRSWESSCRLLDDVDSSLGRAVSDLFLRKGWLAAECAELSVSGTAVLRDEAFREAASHRRVLLSLPELLFGDHARAIREIREAGIAESPRIRTASMEKAAHDLEQEIVDVLEREPLETQPQTIVVASRQDFKEWSEEASGRICGRMAQAGRPAAVTIRLIDGRGRGRMPESPGEDALYVRCFVDYLVDVDREGGLNAAPSVLAAGRPARYVDGKGRVLDAVTVWSCWQEHLRALAGPLGRSRLLLLAAHSEPAPGGDGSPEAASVDWIGRLAGECPIGAESFITLAASVGLFNEDVPRRYERSSKPCRISLHLLARREYVVRHARESDMDRLCTLEKLCWRHTRATRKQIRGRLQRYPRGQFVLEREGIVLGVIYSQRIASVEALMARKAADVHELHDESGAIVQLIAVNIDPQVQNAGYGDQLLEFMLQRCGLMTGVERVAAVTLCKSFDAAGSVRFEDYVQQRGSGQDPVLTFHQSHGARIVRVVPGYRPQDLANLTNGVLVSYDILNRPRRRERLEADGVAASLETAVTRYEASQIAEFVRREAAQLLGIQEQEVDGDRPVMEMGLDSADLLKLQRLCEQRFDLRLQTGFFFEYASIQKVVDHLALRLSARPERPAVALWPGAGPSRRHDDPVPASEPLGVMPRFVPTDIAVIGMSCKLPGGVETPEELWRVLAASECVIGPFPAARTSWPGATEFPGIEQGGFVDDADAFDASFFRISPAEAQVTDPQQRILLELAWACIEDAGLLPSVLKGSKTGVFVGASNCDYSRLMQEAGLDPEVHHGVGSSLAILANRISYFFDLSGPSMVVDTACSSSLVALHSAIRSLRSGECAAALVGGVNLICHSDLSIGYHKAGMLADDGRCKVFDVRANGYVRSEGAALLMLKPLSAAIADQNQIHAVIRGSAINHGGLSAGLTVPNPQKQKELLLEAWKDAGIAAGDIGYFEAHGTGTALGDPIEVQGIRAAYSEHGSPDRPCLIGSVKSNLGHLEPAAGATGLLKVILAFRHRQIPASINFTELNPRIQLDGTPFVIADRLRDWVADGPRVAAISSFGSGGTNAHVVVQEHRADRRSRKAESDQLFVLSSANEDRLRSYVGRVIRWLERPEAEGEFDDAIFTWQVGRTAMRHRLAIRVRDRADLLEKLPRWMAGDRDLSDTFSGERTQKDAGSQRAWQTRAGRQAIGHALAERDLGSLGALWTSGADVDWRGLYEDADGDTQRRRTVSVPTYPFARERFWIGPGTIQLGSGKEAGSIAAGGVRHALLHPLLHANTSDLSRQSYDATFSGDEFYLADHKVRADDRGAQKILPAVAYLEMARAAIERALPERRDTAVVELRDTVWVEPIVVNERKHIRIALVANDAGQIDFEVYSEYAEREVLHCQGRAITGEAPTPATLDLTQLKRAMTVGTADAGDVYPVFDRMGLIYGPSFQGIRAIHWGSEQLLAEIRLPQVVEGTFGEYVLHPVLMDGAMQAAMSLVDGASERSKAPRLPFALEKLRIVSACSPDMAAWVRYAPGVQPGDSVLKVDIDLTDARGNVCVQMHGLSSRESSREARRAAPHDGAAGTLLAAPVWQAINAAAGDAGGIEFSEHHVVLCDLPGVDLGELRAGLLHADCSSLGSEPQASIAQRYSDYAVTLFERIQGLLERKSHGRLLFQLVVADRGDSSVLSGLSGLFNTAALENPKFTGQVILTGEAVAAEVLASRLRQELSLGHETLVRLEGETRLVSRWQDVTADQETLPNEFKDHGVYLITGGLGGLGGLFAKEILAQARHARVVLTGRSELTPARQARLDKLSTEAGRLSYRQVDLVNLDEVTRLVVGINEEFGRLDGILHCAGMIADSFILKKTGPEFSRVLVPKVAGTFHLDQASQDVELDFFVLFSSIAGAFGNVGQADYAAANGFMDHFAAHRNGQVAARQRHGRTRSINWPLWQSGGMTMEVATQDLLQEATGLWPMGTASGLRAFHRCLALPYSQILVLEGDLGRLRDTVLAGHAVASLPPRQPESVQAAPMDGRDAETLAERTQEYLRRECSAVLKTPAHRIDPGAALEEYGIDSMLAMKLTSRLEETFGPLPKTLFFEYRTLTGLTKYFVANCATQLTKSLRTNRGGAAASAAEPVGHPAPTASVSTRRFVRPRATASAPQGELDDIAIIGLSGRYPEALNIEEYWRNLREGRDCIVEVPPARWDWRKHYSEDRSSSGRHYSKWGGFIAGVDEFEPLFFNISPRDAKYIDPQERLFLQQAWQALEDAGYTRASLQVPQEGDVVAPVGVYVGVMWSEYQLLGAQAGADSVRMGFAGNLASIANRVSYALSFHGPSMTVDTMCSSSLTAVHIACQDLKLRHTRLAIAGGVNVSVHPNKYLMLSVGQFISSDGHCQSFGEGGDGYIPGEGVGVVVLKRLSEARLDGDHIYGVIRGSALTHGGKTNGYTVPNPQAQAASITHALEAARVDARHVSYVEAHGTGTKLGDPIEIAALSRAFGKYTSDTQFCRIGSAKSNIGHCESAAGIAGLTKVLLQMQHQEIVPSLHSAQLNPHIDFSVTPFVVNQTATRWERPVIDGRTMPRLAGISSFGAGGSNAHMILEEYQTPAEEPIAAESVAILLSARAAGQLREKARELLDFVRARRGTLDLVSMAYTLQVGREAMEERLGFVVGSVEQLIDKLQAYVDGARDIDDAVQGQVKRGNEGLSLFSTDVDLRATIDKWLTGGKLSSLLDLWAKGLAPDWSRLYGETRPRRMSLPAYPFARERYWIDAAPEGPCTSRIAAVLHPLLHRNTSDLSGLSYRSTFSGDEPFVTALAGRKVLSPAACLEMARAAIADAVPARGEAMPLELREVVWGPPVVVGSAEVRIALSAADQNAIDFEIYTEEGGQETVHLQGRAIPGAGQVPARLDAGQLRAQGHHLVELSGGAADGLVLHPNVIDGALRFAAGSLDSAPASLEVLRIASGCAPEMQAWVRPSQASRHADELGGVDVDLVDRAGNVAVQMRGLTWQRPLITESGPVAEGPAPVSLSAPRREEIAFLDSAAIASVAPAAAPMEPKRPARIALTAPGSAAAAPGRPGARPRVALADPTAGSSGQLGVHTGAVPVRLFDCGDGIFSLEVAGSGSKDAIALTAQGLLRVNQESGLKVLILSGLEHCFPRGARDEYNEAVERGLFRRLSSFPYPVVALLRGGVIGAGTLAAALCDFMVCSEDVRLGFTDARQQVYPTPAEARLLRERLGAVHAHDVLYAATSSTGRELRAKGWTGPILPDADVEAHARELAVLLAAKSRDALRLLKEHLTRALPPLVDDLTRVDVPSAASEEEGQARPVAVVRYGREGLKDLLVDPSAHYGAIVLVGEDPELPDAVAADVRRLILESRIPVVAALTADARGNAWLAAELCDDQVYCEKGVYSSASIGQNLTRDAVAVFVRRFGGEAAGEILLTGRDYSGLELRERVGALTVVEREEVLPVALRLARSLGSMPPSTVETWRREAAAFPQGTTHDIPSVSQDETPSPVGPIALRSDVVTATGHPEGIVVVQMNDREAKNMFSDALVEGVREVFARIDQMPGCKVLILTGYDSYFASGGTKETLLSIQQGKARFTDIPIFHAALECKVPVIAAMQGHGVGAGWSMGMFADLVLLSEESRYVSPYMDYGFTPGAGATLSLPEKLGTDLSRESLLTARTYTGGELRKRGLALRVLPRAEVQAAAMALARQIARFPRVRSIDLKRRLTENVRATLEETYRRELAMHEETFVGRADTLSRIQDAFQPVVQTAPAPRPDRDVETSNAAGDVDALSAVTATLKALLASELQAREADVDERAQFVDLGLDSITGVTWIRKINQRFQTSIEATKVYSYPTLSQLGQYVKEEAEKRGTLPRLNPTPAVEAPRVPAKREPPSREFVAVRSATATLISRRTRGASRLARTGAAQRPILPIAVIGMAGQFPQARDLDEYWQNIAEGRNCITRVPKDRWDPQVHYQPGEPAAGKTYSQWAGSMEEYDRFDPLFFSISPTEAESMDPQQRLFLQACWHAIENAGYDARALSGSRCGVFAGCTTGDYQYVSRPHQLSAQGFTGSATSILAGRISYFLNLQGPSVSIDTACSSALVALAQACDSLISGGSDVALAGGVYVMTGPEMHIRTSQSGMLSSDGRCFTFDQRANGFVPGEGVGVIVLKRLADAERDRDIIHGVIEGWGVNQDGKTNGITAPNPEAQSRLMREIYERFNIDPAKLQLVEAHGTGTKLGDPIEVEGLRASFAKFTDRKTYCALGSVKSNIGHCLTAAGIAGTLKLLLALKHKQLPPSINFERLNEHIDLECSPFYVNTRLQEWALDGARKRQAAVSSFGFGGTNAHVVISEYQPPAEHGRRGFGGDRLAKTIVPLSARTAERLTQKAQDLLAFVRNASPSPDLSEIAYTLQVGREAMDERLGFVVSSIEELSDKLQAWMNGEPEIDALFRGQVKRSKDSTSIISLDEETRDSIVARWIGTDRLARVLELWVNGLELDWNRLWGAEKPQRICLPTYPFAKERYWIDPPAAGAVSSGASAAAARHPLVHRNTSDLGEQRYTSTFTGDEFFFSDHRVRTDGCRPRRVFPGAACLEMAREAISRAWPGGLESSSLELRDTVWLSPILIEEKSDVSITLFPCDDQRADFEIHTVRNGEVVVHCEGQAAFVRESPPARLDLEMLGRRMAEGTLAGSSVYCIFESMGLHYGPAFQGITAIQLGRNELIAQLRLPRVVESSLGEYVLHPSMLDSALQGSIGLIFDPKKTSVAPALPFAMQSMYVASPSAPEMTAWVRRSGKSRPGQLILDVDLCDGQGNVSAQVRGFAFRLLESEAYARSGPTARTEPRLGTTKDTAFYERLIANVVAGEVSADEAAEIG